MILIKRIVHHNNDLEVKNEMNPIYNGKELAYRKFFRAKLFTHIPFTRMDVQCAAIRIC